MNDLLTIHPYAIVESKKIGKNSKINAFTHICPGVTIGMNCKIEDYVFIENDVIIGDNVILKCGVKIYNGSIIENDVLIGPNATLGSDIKKNDKAKKTTIRKGATIGASAIVLTGTTVGKNSNVLAGTLVESDVPAKAIVQGNPAFISGYISQSNLMKLSKIDITNKQELGNIPSGVRDVAFYKLPLIVDMRGNLSFAEYGQYLPFIPKRYFIVFDVSNQKLRGEHAHKTLQEFLVCVKGNCTLILDDGINSEEIVLDSPNIAVYVPPMVWRIHYKYSNDAVLLVLASDVYDPDDYIRDYEEFQRMINEK